MTNKTTNYSLPVVECRKCTSPVEATIENSVYGCDSGCEYVRVTLHCHACYNEWNGGTFGYYDDYAERLEYFTEIIKEYTNANN